MRYLMTHSLLSAWLYSMQDNPYADATTEADPMEDFLKVLHREPTPTTEAMQNGIDFENLVTAIIQGQSSGHEQWNDAAANIANRLRGGVLQCRSYKEVYVDGLIVLLHGRLDCLKAGEISDIKFTKNYDPGKYFHSTQHPMYLELVPEAVRFTYLASNGSTVWSETYRRDETRSIIPTIRDFLSWLNTVGLMDIYKGYWIAQ